jgi:hypothetical protein
MIRTLLVCACLATVCGCSSIRKTVNKGAPEKTVNKGAPEKTAEAPKQYEYHDMGRGGNPNFARPNPAATQMVN